MSVIGVDLGGTNLRVGLLQNDQVLWRSALPTEAKRGLEYVLQNMFRLIRQALQASRELGQLATGIGVGAPGPVNPLSGEINGPPNLPGWDHVPLADLLLTEFCLPVSLNNDANAAALGEWLYGAGRGHHNLVYVTISTGIGAGVICNDTLLVGAHGSAAEVGHLCLQAVGGEPCGCGRLGCFEAYASGTGMVRRTRERLAGSQESSVLRAQTKITPQRIAEAARQQDQFAQAIIQETTECLGIGLANVLSLYDPSVLVLGGGLTNLWSELVAPAVSAMRRLTFAPNADHLLVTRPVLGDDAGLIGAGALVSYQLGRQ